jgi:nitrogen regulatory protein P-II 1
LFYKNIKEGENMLKEVQAYVRKERINEVIKALEEVGVCGMTIIKIAELADWADPEESKFSVKYADKHVSALKIELICTKEKVEPVIAAIRKAGATGHPGDGKIFISSIEKAVSIRTGETGLDAIK